MAGSSSGRSPSDLFAYADAHDAAVRAAGGADGASPDTIPMSNPDPDLTGGWGDMVRRPTPSPPWLDEAVIRYGQTGEPSLKIGSEDAMRDWLQPVSASQPPAATTPEGPGQAAAPLSMADYDPHLDARPIEGIDPNVQRAAEALRDQIRKQSDYDRFEYSGTIYRDRNGVIGSTALTRGAAGSVPMSEGVPAGATILGFVHNHPFQSALDSGRAAHYNEPTMNWYLKGGAAEPSSYDMAAMGVFATRHHLRVDPSALVYIDGPGTTASGEGSPNGTLQAFDRQFVGHPTAQQAAENLGLAKPYRP